MHGRRRVKVPSTRYVKQVLLSITFFFLVSNFAKRSCLVVLTNSGNGYTSAASFVSSGSAEALATVKDADGTTDRLIFEVHKYLDADNSGTNVDCVSDQVDSFQDLTQWLTQNKRIALLAETGGGSSSPSCLKGSY